MEFDGCFPFSFYLPMFIFVSNRQVMDSYIHPRSNHPHAVFLAMETVMTLIIDESEDVSVDLLTPLLASITKESQVCCMCFSANCSLLAYYSFYCLSGIYQFNAL